MQNLQTIEDRKKNVALAAGIDLEKVHRVRLDINKMLEAGLLVDVDLHGFSCLRAGVSWEELGINIEDDRRSRMSTGTKYLAPVKYVKKLTSLEVRFRQCLDRYSSDVMIFRPWRWLPFSAYDEWVADWKTLIKELEILKAEIVANYDNIQDENRRYFEQVARRAWKAYQLPYEGKAAGGRAFEDYQAFEDHIIDSALAKTPRIEFIKEGIYPDYKTGYAITPPEVFALYAEEEKVQAEASAADANARLAWDAEREKDLALTEKQIFMKAKAAAVSQAELEHARAQLASMTSPLQEVLLQFRTKIYESVVGAAKSIQSNGHLRGKTAEMLAGMKGLYETLASVTEDTDLETALASLQNALDKAPADGKNKYDIGAVESALTSLTSLTQSAADDLARAAVQTTRASVLELD